MRQNHDPPFTFTVWQLAVLPVSAVMAKTATAQVDAIYAVADDPATPQHRATQLAAMAGSMMKRLRNRS